MLHIINYIRSKQSLSRVLFRLRGDDYLSRRTVACTLERHNPKGRRDHLNPFLFGLAPDGVYRADTLLHRWCALTDTVPPLPLTRRFTFLWHYSLWLPTPDVIRHPALRSSDFPRTYARNRLSYLLSFSLTQRLAGVKYKKKKKEVCLLHERRNR